MHQVMATKSQKQDMPSGQLEMSAHSANGQRLLIVVLYVRGAVASIALRIFPCGMIHQTLYFVSRAIARVLLKTRIVRTLLNEILSQLSYVERDRTSVCVPVEACMEYGLYPLDPIFSPSWACQIIYSILEVNGLGCGLFELM